MSGSVHGISKIERMCWATSITYLRNTNRQKKKKRKVLLGNKSTSMLRSITWIKIHFLLQNKVSLIIKCQATIALRQNNWEVTSLKPVASSICHMRGRIHPWKCKNYFSPDSCCSSKWLLASVQIVSLGFDLSDCSQFLLWRDYLLS